MQIGLSRVIKFVRYPCRAGLKYTIIKFEWGSLLREPHIKKFGLLIFTIMLTIKS